MTLGFVIGQVLTDDLKSRLNTYFGTRNIKYGEGACFNMKLELSKEDYNFINDTFESGVLLLDVDKTDVDNINSNYLYVEKIQDKAFS